VATRRVSVLAKEKNEKLLPTIRKELFHLFSMSTFDEKN